ncbi:MAG TPA: DNA-binding protein WhiA [Clostridiales bacterium]|jgi:DNA-binding transcriptional regulator WhiA|nr:DNA-binding protein WhiA [Clostridiales bacterium]
MSFSGDVKNQLCQIALSKDCCALAELYGLLLFATVFSAKEIRVVTGTAKLPPRIDALGRRVLQRKGLEGLGLSRLPFEKSPAGQGKITLSLTDEPTLHGLFSLFGYEPDKQVVLHLHNWHMEEDCCRMAFLRGVFLTGGYISDPERDYYLEITTPHRALGREFMALLGEMGFSAKQMLRRSSSVIYFKESEQIEAFLTMIGAHRAVLTLMEAKVIKDVRNHINRKVNCETANLLRSVETGQSQAEIIRAYLDKFPLESLSPPLQEAAHLRLQYPDESLSALAKMADPPLTKSGLNHRLTKLMKIAKEALGQSKE